MEPTDTELTITETAEPTAAEATPSSEAITTPISVVSDAASTEDELAGEVIPSGMPATKQRPLTEAEQGKPLIPIGETLIFYFEDRDQPVQRPGVVVDGRQLEDGTFEFDLFVMFSPHDRINGANVEPKVMLCVKEPLHPSVSEDVYRRCWMFRRYY